jgi:chromosome segregation ATPase
MKTFLFLFLFTIILTSLGYSQSKKEQIQTLNISLDSVKYVLDQERDKTIKNEADKEALISNLNLQIKDLNEKIKSYSANNSNLNKEIANKNNQIKLLQIEIADKNDSLMLLNDKLLSEDIVTEIELTYSTLNKPATQNMHEIGDWLSQFTLICENSSTYFDKETAKFYSGEQEPLEIHGKVTISNSIYKEGIIYTIRGEYEGASYQLIIPVLTLADVKRNIEKLCKNMGACIQPEEMEIKYEKTDFGIKVYWGGGC